MCIYEHVRGWQDWSQWLAVGMGAPAGLQLWVGALRQAIGCWHYERMLHQPDLLQAWLPVVLHMMADAPGRAQTRQTRIDVHPVS